MLANLYQKAKRWVRFLFGGGANTTFTYVVYLGLKTMLPYQGAYFIAYAMGVVFSYWFNAVVVFRVPLTWKGFLSYPIVYVIQYLLSALFLGTLVELLGVSVAFAPIVVVVVLFPITYLTSKFVLNRDGAGKRLQT